MESKLVYLLVLSSVTIGWVSCQSISCYDCDPQNFASDCGDPDGNMVRSTPCTVDVENGTAICLSTFLNVTGGTTNLTGIYRGCRTLRPDVADFCDWFREERQGLNISVLSCEACSSTRCNTIGFRDDGTSGSHNILAFSVLALFVNTLLVIALSGKSNV